MKFKKGINYVILQYMFENTVEGVYTCLQDFDTSTHEFPNADWDEAVNVGMEVLVQEGILKRIVTEDVKLHAVFTELSSGYVLNKSR